MKFSVLAVCLTLVAQGFCGAESAIALSDVTGKPHAPLQAGDRKGVVLFFVSPFCPTSNAFTPEINRIAADYSDRFHLYLVEAEAGISVADARKHVEMQEIKATMLLDPEQRLARLTQARITPEAVVLDPRGEKVYQGRINDLYATQTKKLKEPTTHDLRAALDSIAAGKAVATAVTKAVGCSITLKP